MSLANGRQIFVEALVDLQKQMIEKDTESFQYFAEKWADLVIDLIKSAKVKEGISVTTAGTASNQTGQTTTKGTLE